MTDTEKPEDQERFWTPTMIVLVGINIVFLGLIAFGLWLIADFYRPVLAAWLEKLLAV